DGDPVENIKLLQDRDNIKVVMKDGVYYKRLILTPGM
ncbi:imidazolonepropionase-like amidohydrolase, partial [Paraburkholderia sp. GAS38]